MDSQGTLVDVYDRKIWKYFLHTKINLYFLKKVHLVLFEYGYFSSHSNMYKMN